tara:strand:+ start:18 stop:917 length:900 start_codon:yes stop_codon:yes gene_type:complete
MILDTEEAYFTKCTLCSSRQIRNLKNYKKDYLVKCKSCNFIFSSKIPTSLELNQVYENYSRGNEITSLTRLKNQNLAKIILSYHPSITTCLDIACGEGSLLEAFKELSIETSGTEHESGKNLLVQKGIDFIEGEFFPKTEKRFDLIIFTEAIEHINDQNIFLKHAIDLLNPGGLIYMTTPNVNSLEKRILRSRWGMFVYPEHLSYYSPRTINLLHTKLGLEKVINRTENISVYRLVEYFNSFYKKKDSDNYDPISSSNRIQDITSSNLFLNIIKRVINFLLNLFGLGTSLITLYRKPLT